MYAYCERHSIDVRPIGKLIVATAADELRALDDLEARARANGVPGIRRLGAAELREIEPNAAGIAALHSPRTGIVEFAKVCERLGDDAREAGAELRLGWKVSDVRASDRQIRLTGPGSDTVVASRAVFCAGLWSDRLATRAGASPDPRIIPFRGGYLRLRGSARGLVRGLIYPVPDPALPFLGVHITPQIDGEVLIGPSALLVGARDAYNLSTIRWRDLSETIGWPGTWRMAARWWRTGLHEMRMAASRRVFAEQAARYIPVLQAEDMVPAFGGVRAQAVGRDGGLVDDFVMSFTPRAVHVRNAPSPAATSSLSLAARIVDAAERHLD